jgi:hypothetical protein
MRKFCNDEPLTEQEFDDLSWLSLIDRSRAFEPGNCHWATTDAERSANRAFYRSLAPRVH